MQRIVVISDTHEDIRAIEGILSALKDNDVDTVIHLGDYYDDTFLFEERGFDLIKVPGTWDCRYYGDPNVSNRKFIEVDGWTFFLTHTPESHYNDLACDIKPETIIHRRDTDVFLYGHTHRAELRRRDGMIFINPGHMSRDEQRGCPLTYALLEIEQDVLTASILQLHNTHPYKKRKYEKTPSGFSL